MTTKPSTDHLPAAVLEAEPLLRDRGIFQRSENSEHAERRRARMAATIYFELRDQIVALARLPGSPLNEQEVAQQRGVSRTPVREAILRLADDGLAEIRPQSGTFVSRIALGDLPDIIFMRHTLESAIVRELVAHEDLRASPSLAATIATQRKAARQTDREAFHQGDDRFHAELARLAGHARTWETIDRLKLNLDRFRRLTLLGAGQMLRVIDEHVEIHKAIRAGDIDRSETLLVSHLREPLRMVEAVRQHHGDLLGP